MGRGMVPCSSVRVVVGGGIHPCLQKHLFVEFLGRVVAHALLTVVHSMITARFRPGRTGMVTWGTFMPIISQYSFSNPIRS